MISIFVFQNSDQLQWPWNEYQSTENRDWNYTEILFFLPPLSLSGYNFHFLWTECLILLYKKVNLRKPLDFGLQTVSRSLSNWRHIYFIWTFIIFSCRLPSMAIHRNKKGFDWICKWNRERTEKNHEHIKTCPVLFFPPRFSKPKGFDFNTRRRSLEETLFNYSGRVCVSQWSIVAHLHIWFGRRREPATF